MGHNCAMSTRPRLINRTDARPLTAKTGPHRHLSEQAPPSLWGELVAMAFAIDGVRQGHSTVSMADSMAALLPDLPQNHGPWSLAVGGYVEPFHIHGVRDTSIHAVLPSDLAAEVVVKRWGEAHTYAEFDTQVMIYAPRNSEELIPVLELLKASVAFARESGMS
jgi:hypothetical protein